MLTRARTLLSRVFSLDTPSSQIRLDEVFDDIHDETSDENDTDNRIDDDIDNSTTGAERDDDDDDEDGLTDSDENESQSTTTTTKGKYERQINDYPTQAKSKNFIRPHEKSKQDRLINAMQIATSRCNVESMKRLLTNFDMNINHRDQYGMSYLEHAILMGSFDMVDLLIRFGCDLYQCDSNGHSYLYVAIETTTNKSLPIIRLLLESNCSCLRLMDIVSLTSPQQILHINSQDFLLLNAHLLLILKYHLRRMVLNDILNLINCFIQTNLLLCKNDEHYGLSLCTKNSLNHFNYDFLNLFLKTLGHKHALKLIPKLQTFIPITSDFIPLNHDDIQPFILRIEESMKQVPDLRHLCRLLIRQNLRNFKKSTLESIVLTAKLQDYLLYTPI
mgnify:CR=1 FL=1